MSVKAMKAQNEFLLNHSREVLTWAAEIDPSRDWKGHVNASVIGIVNGGRMIAAAVYSNHRPEHATIQFSIVAVSPWWTRKETLYQLMAYPFIELGVYKIGVAIPEQNHKALKTAKHAGFKKEAMLAHELGPGKHEIKLRILKPEFERLFGGFNNDL